MRGLFKNKFVPGFFLLMVSLVGGCGSGGDGLPKAPDFELRNLDGEPVTLKAHRGKIVVLDFWATWCPPCRKSIPELIALQKKYKDNGVVVLGVSVDDPMTVNNRLLKAFKEKFRINYPILRATRALTSDYFGNERFGVPTLFVIDQKGHITDKQVGYMPGRLEQAITKLL